MGASGSDGRGLCPEAAGGSSNGAMAIRRGLELEITAAGAKSWRLSVSTHIADQRALGGRALGLSVCGLMIVRQI
jgi:hypothetical protein